MSRVAIYECGPAGERPALLALKDEGLDLVECADGKELLEEIVQHRPDAVVYGIGKDCDQDLGVLRLLRRIAPGLPLVLLAAEGSLGVQRLLRNLQPTYFAMHPVEPGELRDAVRAGLERRPPGRDAAGRR